MLIMAKKSCSGKDSSNVAINSGRKIDNHQGNNERVKYKFIYYSGIFILIY